MTTDKRQFTMRMQPENFDKIKIIASINKRSIAMQIEYLLEQYISDYENANGIIPLTEKTVSSKVLQKNSGGINNLSVNSNVYNR